MTASHPRDSKETHLSYAAAPADDQSNAPAWLDEKVGPDGLARFRARIGGMHCSLCTGTLEKALGRQPGVAKVAVSLTHEQALVEYDPAVVRPQDLVDTLRDIGYSARDPAKVRPYEEEEGEHHAQVTTRHRSSTPHGRQATSVR